jgi:hypothetical protein
LSFEPFEPARANQAVHLGLKEERMAVIGVLETTGVKPEQYP